MTQIARRAGLRSVGSTHVKAFEWSISPMCPDLLIFDLCGDGGPAMLDRLRRTGHALAGRRVCVIVNLALLDEALSLLDRPGADFLCEPTDSEVIVTLVMAGLQPPCPEASSMQDAARDHEPKRLENLSEEVRRLALTIEQLTGRETLPAISDRPAVRDRHAVFRPDTGNSSASEMHFYGQSMQPAVETKRAGPTHSEIRGLIRARRLRDQFLPADLFADPAWDMLLDLLAARLAGKRVSVSSLCIAAAVPPTTALRWIRQLTERQILVRVDDPNDGRRVFVDLSEQTSEAILCWVDAVRRKGGLLVPTP
ncbi:MAG: MarR family transcriptional regulator [Alphaproteobacteria bacterium]|nr:MarR family transcriptional regulator [Alphaproteobacteria bacterium]MBU0794754.1 MarR family transcriptional regulator [Alphaproteobacteria bacterium]MBU0874345.1 MarR family transcriptional regulator [Alphaproteobacteria bacterium]MBU1769677.1 MarR family transcriptional regulator [Alphaproteobacteria bacterium]